MKPKNDEQTMLSPLEQYLKQHGDAVIERNNRQNRKKRERFEQHANFNKDNYTYPKQKRRENVEQYTDFGKYKYHDINQIKGEKLDSSQYKGSRYLYQFKEIEEKASNRAYSEIESVFRNGDELMGSYKDVPIQLHFGDVQIERHGTLMLKSSQSEKMEAKTEEKINSELLTNGKKKQNKSILSMKDVDSLIEKLDYLFETKTREKARLDVRLLSTKPSTTAEEQEALTQYKKDAQLKIAELLIDCNGAIRQLHGLSFKEPRIAKHLRKGSLTEKHQKELESFNMWRFISDSSKLCVTETDYLLRMNASHGSTSANVINNEHRAKTLKDYFTIFDNKDSSCK